MWWGRIDCVALLLCCCWLNVPSHLSLRVAGPDRLADGVLRVWLGRAILRERFSFHNDFAVRSLLDRTCSDNRFLFLAFIWLWFNCFEFDHFLVGAIQVILGGYDPFDLRDSIPVLLGRLAELRLLPVDHGLCLLDTLFKLSLTLEGLVALGVDEPPHGRDLLPELLSFLVQPWDFSRLVNLCSSFWVLLELLLEEGDPLRDVLVASREVTG